MKYFKAVFLCLLFVSCASSETSSYEEAKFSLDAADYDAAITAGLEALAENPDNVLAARVVASAYLGRSGIDYLDLAEGITDLQNGTVTNLQQIGAVLPATATMADVRSAIETLEGLTGIGETTITNEDLQDAAFDLGLLMVIEQFAIGWYNSNEGADTSGISDDNAADVQADLVSFDNRLVSAGMDSGEDFIAEVRQTFCILEPISAGSGFTTAEYQDFVACELADDSSTVVTTTVANCNAINPDNQTAGVQACYDEDTNL